MTITHVWAKLITEKARGTAVGTAQGRRQLYRFSKTLNVRIGVYKAYIGFIYRVYFLGFIKVEG